METHSDLHISSFASSHMSNIFPNHYYYIQPAGKSSENGE